MWYRYMHVIMCMRGMRIYIYLCERDKKVWSRNAIMYLGKTNVERPQTWQVKFGIQIGSDWPQMGQIKYGTLNISLISQWAKMNTKLVLDSPRFVPFGANGGQIWHPCLWWRHHCLLPQTNDSRHVEFSRDSRDILATYRIIISTWNKNNQ